MVTQADVARQAGVTQATVSRVLTGKGYVDERTRDGVLAATRQLRYTPASNNDARRLVARRHGTTVRTNVVALLWAGAESLSEDAWLARLLEGIELRLSKAQQQLLLVKFTHEQTRLPRNIRAGHVDGVIIICPTPEWRPILQALDECYQDADFGYAASYQHMNMERTNVRVTREVPYWRFSADYILTIHEA